MIVAGPDPRLLDAAAMVFVDDLRDPRPDPADVHHLGRVLRLHADERLIAADGRGRWVQCRVASDGGRGYDGAHLELAVDGSVEREPLPATPVTVAFAPVKGDRPEWVVQKLTELGVDRIVLVRTVRGVVRWEGERAKRALDRLARVAREAAAQCRRPRLPELHGPMGLGEVDDLVGGTLVLAHPGGGAPSLEHPAVAVGPEGGWDEAELRQFPRSVGLGPSVLRAETAAMAAGALLCALRAGAVAPLA